jgi:hypothetical protein
MSNQTAIEPVIEPFALEKDMPANLPQPASIAELCKANGQESTGLAIMGESQGELGSDMAYM